MSFVKKLVNYFRAGYPCLSITTTEEVRAQRDLVAAAKELEKKVVTWSAAQGIEHLDSGKRVDNSEFPQEALKALHAEEDAVIILRDLHHFFEHPDPTLPRILREFLMEAPNKGSNVVLLSPEFKLPSSLMNLVLVVPYALPSPEELKVIATGIQESSSKKIKDATNEVIYALSGLSTTEAENALSLSLVEAGEFVPEIIFREKMAAVRRNDLLEIVTPNPRGLDGLGGLENIKEWILKRKKAFSPEAKAYRLPMPKGCLIVGVPGSGKSETAKCVGTALGIPTLRLDIGALFGSLVGESERRCRMALDLADAMAPCVLWADEVEKGLAGASGSGSGDSGTSHKVLQTLLTWMQERTKPVFCVFTANRVDNLPPEFLRKGGRFDELFTVDLPHAGEREAIADVLLRRYDRDPQNFDIQKIVAATADYTGAEMDTCIAEAMYNAFDEGKEVTTEHILAAATAIVPLSKTAAERVEAIRKWGENRARPASKPQQKQQTTTRKLKI